MRRCVAVWLVLLGCAPAVAPPPPVVVAPAVEAQPPASPPDPEPPPDSEPPLPADGRYRVAVLAARGYPLHQEAGQLALVLVAHVIFDIRGRELTLTIQDDGWQAGRFERDGAGWRIEPAATGGWIDGTVVLQGDGFTVDGKWARAELVPLEAAADSPALCFSADMYRLTRRRACEPGEHEAHL
jgi:hypothetical protein